MGIKANVSALQQKHKSEKIFERLFSS